MKKKKVLYILVLFFLIGVFLIILSSDFIFVNALALKSSFAPSSVVVGSSYQIKCDYGVQLGCIAPSSGGQGCTFAGFSGTAAVFNCVAKTVGVKDNYCYLFNWVQDSRCIAQQTKIASTTVVNPNTVSLISSSAPASVNLGGTFQMKCDFGVLNFGCIYAMHGNNQCTFAGFSGTAALFNCVANTAGTIDNYCNLFSWSGDSRCKPQTNKIQNTVVSNVAVYSVQKVNVGNTVENRFYYNERHFMTIISDSNGAIAIRPHPGLDVNGWGSSLYLQPFVPGAVLRGTTVNNVNTKSNGIEILASGIISNGATSSLGTWNSDILFSFDPTAKDITGTGNYNIYASNTGYEIDLYKLASNYLVNVPLLNGSIGDTGDMKYANITGAPFNFIWVPKSGSTFPQDNRNPITIEAVGDYNQVDSAKQGYAAIAAAYKPSMKISLKSSRSSEDIIFGGIYDSSESQQFWQDNVGITPLIQKASPYTSYNFDLQFDSKAISGDH